MLIRTRQIAAERQAEMRRALSGEDVFWKAVFTPMLSHFRGRGDTVTQDSTTWGFNEDTNFSWPVDTNLRLRIVVQETGGAANDASFTYSQIWYSRNGGTITQVTAATSICRYALSSQFTNNTNITKQLSGTGTMLVGRILEQPTTLTSNVGGFTANNHVEIEHNIILRSADGVTGGDVFTFFYRSDTSQSLVTPTVTATAVVFTPDQTAYRFAEDGTESGATLIGSLNTPLSRTL